MEKTQRDPLRDTVGKDINVVRIYNHEKDAGHLNDSGDYFEPSTIELDRTYSFIPNKDTWGYKPSIIYNSRYNKNIHNKDSTHL